MNYFQPCRLLRTCNPLFLAGRKPLLHRRGMAAVSVFGVENPLLDIQVKVGDDFLAKYALKPADAILAQEQHLPLYEEISKLSPIYVAGGSCQNAIRACQWLLQNKGKTAYAGAVGRDENGETLKRCATKDGVDVHYYYVEDGTPTGVCACLIHNKERSMVTNLAAANKFQKEHLDTPEVKSAVESASVIYTTGFFLTVSTESAIRLGKHCAETNKYFLFNLSARFIIDFFGEQLDSVLPYVDIIFGNEDEAAAFGLKKGWGENLEEIAEKLAGLPKINTQRSRTVVFTQGKLQTIVFHDGKLSKYTPLPVDPAEIVDTNGAGDSFVGGFLAALSKGHSIERCVESAHYVASVTIRCSGTNFEGRTPDAKYQP